MKFDLEILNQYVKDGWVERNDHPSLSISIYNYSRKTQYEGKWDDITLKTRGLVLDNEGNVVAKPFDKFFNYEELVGNKWVESKIPNEPFEVFEKMDGSLGILFNYNDEWILATKGSFTSDQALRGMEILKKYRYEKLIKGFTYLFEIIYPENRIVCEYDFEDLILLAVVDNKDGYELRIHDDIIHLEGIRFRNLYKNLGFKVVKKYDGVRDYSELKSKILQNAEGFVIKFENGVRMKIKGEEYVRLHRILTGFSTYDIWEHLKDGKDVMELVERVPDEFDKWVKEKVSALKYGHFAVSGYCGKAHDYFRYGKYSDVDPEPSKKEFAEHLKKVVDPNLHAIMFAMWDGKRDKADELIWKLIKPKYSKPFWQKETE
jgi:T4 RnlA family RNA ligase